MKEKLKKIEIIHEKLEAVIEKANNSFWRNRISAERCNKFRLLITTGKFCVNFNFRIKPINCQ